MEDGSELDQQVSLAGAWVAARLRRAGPERLGHRLMSASGTLLVADSFRARRSPTSEITEVRGWSKHVRRFAHAAAAAAADAAARANAAGRTQFTADIVARQVRDFLADAADRISTSGDGFPRLECWQEQGRLRFSTALRPLPPLTDTITLRSVPHLTLVHPERKGPNIVLLSDLNARLGAEALLLDTSGNVIEGATTSLVWWDVESGSGHIVAGRAGHVAHRVPSITEALILEAAADGPAPAQISPSRATPGQLTAAEVWAVNALHGIRRVAAIDGTPTAEPDHARLAAYRAAHDKTWETVLPRSTSER